MNLAPIYADAMSRLAGLADDLKAAGETELRSKVETAGRLATRLWSATGRRETESPAGYICEPAPWKEAGPGRQSAIVDAGTGGPPMRFGGAASGGEKGPGSFTRKITGKIRHRRRRGADLAMRLVMLALGLRPRRHGWEPRLRDHLDRWLRGLWRVPRATYARALGFRVIRPASTYRLPEIRCPECGGRLVFEVAQWLDSGIPDVDYGGVLLDCEEDTGDRHRHWQAEWQPVITAAERWAAANVRVIDCWLAEEPYGEPIDDIPF